MILAPWLAAAGLLAAPADDVLDEPVRTKLPRMVELMREGIEVRKPNTSFARRLRLESVFDGSFDYHSCVAAHWSLLVIARIEQDEELEAWLLERLTDEVLERERALLDDLEEEPFLFPYETAWVALMLSELAKREAVDAGVVERFRLEVEARLFEKLEEGDFPENVPPKERGGTGFNGFYKSWQFAFLLLQLSDPISEGAAERLERIRRERLEPHREAIAAHDVVFGYDFLWVPALLALIDRTAPAGAEVPDESPYDPRPLPELPESVTIGTVHIVGLEISRVWPSGIDARAGDTDARAVFNERLSGVLERGDLWSDDFAVVSHWVPQFLWFGIWLADGRP